MIVTFYLPRGNATRSSIMVSLSWNGNRIRKGTGHSCDVANWNAEPTKRKPEYVLAPEKGMAHINKKLKEIKLWAEELDSSDITEKEMETLYMERWRGKKKPETYVPPTGFFEVFHEWLESCSTRITKSGKVMDEKTIENYQSCRDTIKSFQADTKYPVSFEGMDLVFYEKFRHYCIGKKKYSINTFGMKIQILKTFLRECIKKDFPVNPKFQFFETPRKYKGVDYLTMDQLEQIKAVDYTQIDMSKHRISPELAAYCRDVYLFQCYTALRISDVFQLKKSDIKGDRIFLKEQEKTDSPVVIPFMDNLVFEPVSIVKKYASLSDYLFTWQGKERPLIKTVTNKMNFVLEYTTAAIGANFKITTKIGRKTFATYAIAVLKMAKADVMRITGHTTEKSFNRYMGFDADAVIEAYRSKVKTMKVA